MRAILWLALFQIEHLTLREAFAAYEALEMVNARVQAD